MGLLHTVMQDLRTETRLSPTVSEVTPGLCVQPTDGRKLKNSLRAFFGPVLEVTHYFCSYFIGQNSITWLHPTNKVAGKCGLVMKKEKNKFVTVCATNTVKIHFHTFISFPWIIIKICDSFRVFSVFSVRHVLALQSLWGSDSGYGSRGQNRLR